MFALPQQQNYNQNQYQNQQFNGNTNGNENSYQNERHQQQQQKHHHHQQQHHGQNYNQPAVQALYSGNTAPLSQSQYPVPPAPPSQQVGQVGIQQSQQQQVQPSQKLLDQTIQQTQAQKFHQQALLQNKQNQYFQAQQQQFQNSINRNQVPITSYNNELSHDGSFAYGYTTGDGQQAQAQGFIKNLGNKDLEAQVVQGGYSYTSPDGTPISVKYLADENGFRAEGLHLPTPPPIPEAIARALQYIARVQATNPQLYQQNQQQFSGNYNQLG